MSADTRLRIATFGFRGATSNRRISIASFGYHPLGALVEYWRDVIQFSLSFMRSMAFSIER